MGPCGTRVSRDPPGKGGAVNDPAAPEPARVAFLSPGLEPADRALARDLGLGIIEVPDPGFPLLLTRRGGALELLWTDPAGPGALVVDFRSGPMARRWRTATRRQPLARALGIPRGIRSVLDATAGLGRDAMTLAALGCQVTAVERNRVLVAMLQDGMRRALGGPGEPAEPALVEAVGRIALVIGDAREVMEHLPSERRPDAVYLDPMYPLRGQAGVKKETLALRGLAGGEDESGLLEVARRCARRRVVVKRHPHAPSPGGKPDLVVAGSRVRYCVYLVPPTTPSCGRAP